MKKIIVLGILLLFAAAVVVTGKSTIGMPMEYHSYLKSAQKNESKKIFIGAIEDYQKALAYKPDNIEVERKIAEDYLALEDEERYVAACKTVINSYGKDEDVLKLVDYYLTQDEAEEAITLLRNQQEKDPDNKTIKKKLNELSGEYEEMYYSFEAVSSFHNGNFAFQRDGKYGIMNLTGTVVIQPEYETAGVFDEEGEYAPVSKDGEYYYIDQKDYRRLVPDESCDYLGVFSEGLAAASRNGKYGYLNKEMKDTIDFQWDMATTFCEGIAAVKKGSTWALINSNGKELTDYQYEDVVMDDLGYCSMNQVIWVKTKEGYQLVDKNGKAVSSNVYEEVRPFVSSEPAAVKKNGKWGFVTVEGKEILDFTYDDAKSFSEGFAPVKSGDLWGYTNEKGKLIIESTFEDAMPFSTKGTAAVNNQGWFMIQLDTYK